MAKNDFLSDFMGGNVARARLLRAYVLDQERSLTIKDAARRAGVSEKTALKETKALEKLGIVKKGKLTIMLTNGTAKKVSGKQRVQSWGVDQNFKHLRALSAFIHDVSPVKYETVVSALKSSGKVATIVLSGTFLGDPTRPADLLIAVDAVNERRLDQAIRSLEPMFGREIRYAAFSTPEFRYRLTIQDRLLRDTLDFPHLVLLDRPGLL